MKTDTALQVAIPAITRASRIPAPARLAQNSSPVIDLTPSSATVTKPIVLRRIIGDQLRNYRTEQHRTLREVSRAAQVSLGYLSEVERGQKEASSELLASICRSLDVPLSVLLADVAVEVACCENSFNFSAATLS